nr:hypothetical protein [Microbacterium bovistercoris]
MAALEWLTRAFPLGRRRPAEAADAIAYLAGADLHGATLAVDGGASAVAPSTR